MDKKTVIEISKYAHDNNLTYKKSCEIHGVKECTYYKYKKMYDIKEYRRKVVTKEDIEKILAYSDKYKIPEKQACEILGYKTHITNTNNKHKFGIIPNPIGKAPFTYRKKRINNINDLYFHKPSIQNCYYAGFFAADGCISKNNKTCTITLADKDKLWLEDFKKNINFDGDIRCGVMKNIYCYSTISFTSQQIVNDLKQNFNIIPVKSLILQHPNVTNENLIDAFICGYIDGDGSISLYKCKKTQDNLRISVIGTYDMCQWIQKRFNQIIGKHAGSILKRDNIFIYSISNKQARIVFEHYYNIDVPKLERKWKQEIHEYCANYKKRPPLSRRKGVFIYNLRGELIKHCSTLQEAHEYTGVEIGRISNLCKINDNKHKSKNYMFNRTGGKMKPYEESISLNIRYKESTELDENGTDIEM